MCTFKITAEKLITRLTAWLSWQQNAVTGAGFFAKLKGTVARDFLPLFFFIN
jgi:hypothetical protein